MEAFGKKGKFFGPLPAFVCAFVYVVILRPAEIAIIILTFSEYLIQPFHDIFHLNELSDGNKALIIKLVSFLALGKFLLFASLTIKRHSIYFYLSK